MGIIRSLRGCTPKIGKNCFIAENAVIVGDVEIGDNCSIWYSTVIRGDVNSIKIGNNTNIQDGSILHCLYQKSTIEIGNNVNIGHNVVIHGAKIHDDVLIGMSSTILDYSIVHSNSIVAAGSLVRENTIIESGSIYGGVPAKRLRDIKEEEANRLIKQIASNYLKYSDWYK